MNEFFGAMNRIVIAGIGVIERRQTRGTWMMRVLVVVVMVIIQMQRVFVTPR